MTEDLTNSADASRLGRQLMAEIDSALLGDSGVDLEAAGRELGEGRELFARLYVAYRPLVANQVRRYLNDMRDVEEVVQETFLRLLLALPELETDGQVVAWCRRTATNMCIDRYRAAGRRPRLSPLDDIPAGFDAVYDDDPIELAEDAAIVREALSRLTPLHRAALVMREVEERSLPEIAAALDIPEPTVKHVLHRARKSLRRALADSPLVRVTAAVGLLASLVTGGWVATRQSPKPTVTSAEAPAPVQQDILTTPLPTLGSARVTPKHRKLPAATQGHLPPTRLATTGLPGSASTSRLQIPEVPSVPTLSGGLAGIAPVAMAPAVANVSPDFSFVDRTRGSVVTPQVTQNVTWSDISNGTDFAHSMSQIDIPGVGTVVVTLNRGADTTWDAAVGVNLLTGGQVRAMAVGPVSATLTPNSDGTLFLVLSADLPGQTISGDYSTSPTLLQVATRYAANLGTLISSRLDLTQPGQT